MSRILESKGGFYKHFFLGMFFLLGCYSVVRADPFSWTTFFISLAVSSAITAGTALLQYALTPKPKPIDKNKLQGELQVSSVGEDIFINEIYGARGSDGKGGIKTGTNYFYISDIRGVVETKSSSSGGGKGGKKPETKEHHYYVDLACLVGLNRTRILEIRAGTDVIYRNYPKPTAGQGTHYQCESGTLGGGATIEANVLFASGNAVKLPSNNGTISKSITGDGENHAFYFQYLTATEKSLDITINGEARTIALPPTYGRVESVMLIGSTNAGATTIFIHTPVNDNDNLWLDEIIVGENFVNDLPVTRFSGISGLKYHNYENPYPTYDYMELINPLDDDFRGSDEYNYQPNYDSYGSNEVSLPAGCTLRIYEGNGDQLPDPTLQAYYEAKYGAGATPAYRHRCYFVLDNFEITKYGQIPNLTVISESVEFQTLGAMYAHRAERAGLESAEYDFTDFDNIPLRGFAITSRQAPRNEMEVLNRIFDIDVFENSDGKIVGVVPTDDVLVTIPASDLDVWEGTGEKETKPIGLKSVIKNEYECPKRTDLSYFDCTKDFEVGNTNSTREVTVSEKRDNIETSLVLTEDESQKIVDRLHQQAWAEKDGEEFSTFYKYSWLNPTDLIQVVSLEGETNRIRLKQKNGTMPGKLDFVGVSRRIAYPSPRIFLEPSNRALSYPWLTPPAHIIGTIIDITKLRSTETSPGFYSACAMTDQAYSFKGAILAWEREGGYETLQTHTAQATMGRTIAGSGGILDDVPGGWTPGDWDDDSFVTLDLFFGELETRTDAEVLDRFNTLILGNEVVAFKIATRVNDYPNRWTVSRFRRQLKGTSSLSHAANERVVLLNDAVKFIPLDISEFGNTRNYAFVSSGQDIASASKFSFTWNGRTNNQAPPPTPTLELIPEILSLQDLTLVKCVFGTIDFGTYDFEQRAKVYWKKPGGDYELLTEITPDENNQGTFRCDNLAEGTHYFKTIAQAINGNALSASYDEDSVVIDAEDFVINGYIIQNAAVRTFTGFDNLGKYTGRDTAKVPTAKILPAIDTLEELAGDFVKVKIVGNITGYESDQTAQADSLTSARVGVFDNYGTLLATLTKTFRGTGDLGEGIVGFAGAAADLYFKVQVLNYYGWSSPVYLLSDGSYSTTEPTPDTSPSDLPPIITSISYDTATQVVTINWTPRGGSGTFKLQSSDSEGGTYADVSGQTAISSGATSTTFTIAQTSETQHPWFKIKRNDVTGYSEADDVIIPAIDPAMSPISLIVDQPTAGADFEISWTDRGATGNNRIWESPWGSTSWTLIDSGATNPTTRTPDLAGSYWYRIDNDAIPGEYAYSFRARWFA